MVTVDQESTRYKLLKDCVYSSPLALLGVTDPKELDYISRFLPFSTGFEIECDLKTTSEKDSILKSFEAIPYIMSARVGGSEQRFRIPSGLQGIICLYLISRHLHFHAELNPGSGIHYHVDFTDSMNQVTEQFAADQSEYVLTELDKWGYKGKYNGRRHQVGKGGWAGYRHCYKTLEFRCGEMTFDYKELATNIIHANEIVQNLKTKLRGEIAVNSIIARSIKDSVVDSELVKNFLIRYTNKSGRDFRGEVKELEEKLAKLAPPKSPTVDMSSVINSRTKSI